MDKLSKTAALKAASNAVGTPIGKGTSWCFYAPYYPGKLDGPSTEIRADGYPKIVARRTERVVDLAVSLMGYTGDVYLDGATGSARQLLDLVLSDPGRYIITP